MNPVAQALAETFIRDFWAADHAIGWTHSEQERQLWLTPNTLLVGRVDARGLTADGVPFFGEWKTLNNRRGRYIDDEKFKWRTSPQALTYGVLVEEAQMFTVRWAIKPGTRITEIAKTDFEWYTYTLDEVAHWRNQLIQVADEVRNNRTHVDLPWRTNFGNCFRYGRKYACPFFDKCTTQKWNESMGKPRTPHLDFEREMKNELDKYPSDLVVLDASRTSDYLECPEKYRNIWEGEGYQDESEALTIGSDFHDAIAKHIQSLIPAKSVGPDSPLLNGPIAMERS